MSDFLRRNPHFEISSDYCLLILSQKPARLCAAGRQTAGAALRHSRELTRVCSPKVIHTECPKKPFGARRMVATAGWGHRGRPTGSGKMNGLRERETCRWRLSCSCPGANRVLGV